MSVYRIEDMERGTGRGRGARFTANPETRTSFGRYYRQQLKHYREFTIPIRLYSRLELTKQNYLLNSKGITDTENVPLHVMKSIRKLHLAKKRRRAFMW